MLNKFLQDSLWGFPAQRSHRKQVIVPCGYRPGVVGKSPERNKKYEKHKTVHYLCDGCALLSHYAGA